MKMLPSGVFLCDEEEAKRLTAKPKCILCELGIPLRTFRPFKHKDAEGRESFGMVDTTALEKRI